MHSLKPDINKESLNCFNIANPTKRGNDESPSNSLSHRCNILCRGNTSKILIKNLQYGQLIVRKDRNKNSETYVKTLLETTVLQRVLVQSLWILDDSPTEDRGMQ